MQQKCQSASRESWEPWWGPFSLPPQLTTDPALPCPSYRRATYCCTPNWSSISWTSRAPPTPEGADILESTTGTFLLPSVSLALLLSHPVPFWPLLFPPSRLSGSRLLCPSCSLYSTCPWLSLRTSTSFLYSFLLRAPPSISISLCFSSRAQAALSPEAT